MKSPDEFGNTSPPGLLQPSWVNPMPLGIAAFALGATATSTAGSNAPTTPAMAISALLRPRPSRENLYVPDDLPITQPRRAKAPRSRGVQVVKADLPRLAPRMINTAGKAMRATDNRANPDG